MQSCRGNDVRTAVEGSDTSRGQKRSRAGPGMTPLSTHARTYSGMPLLDEINSSLSRADSAATAASETTERDGGHLSALKAAPPPVQQQQTFVDESTDNPEGNDSFKVLLAFYWLVLQCSLVCQAFGW